LIWEKIIEELRANYRVIAIDLPGFGLSPVPAKPFTLDDYAETVEALCQKLKINNFILVGHSFGGRVSIKIAIKHPTKVKKLILVDSAGIKRERKIIGGLARLFKPIFKQKIMDGARNKIYQAIGSEDYLATPKLQKTYQNIVAEDLSSYLCDIKLPTLIIWGENDKDTPLSDAKLMNRDIKNSKLEIIKNAGHFSFIDQPESFNKILSDFLK